MTDNRFGINEAVVAMIAEQAGLPIYVYKLAKRIALLDVRRQSIIETLIEALLNDQKNDIDETQNPRK